MVANPALQPSLDYIKAQELLFLQSKTLPHSRSRSALSDATEILTDYDTDSLEATSDSSPYRSVDSLAAESVTTLSTVDDLKTPDSTGLTAFHFHLDDNPVKGPQGPHLFRTSQDSLESRPRMTPDWTAEKARDDASTPGYFPTSSEECERRDTPVPDNVVLPPPPPAPGSPNNIEAQGDVANWSPTQVVQWMQLQGFEDSVIEKFFINDITGSILLELQPEDLKELEISSFGKRHQLMSCIRHLRRGAYSGSVPSCDSGLSTPDPSLRQDTITPQSTTAEVGIECTSPIVDDEPRTSRTGSRSSDRHKYQHRQKRGRHGTDIVPEDSVSIVAIEQLLPKLHMCSKGENCRKWQRQQVKIARMLDDLKLDGFGNGIVIAGDPGNAATAPPMTKTPKVEGRASRTGTRTPKAEMKPPRPEAKTPKLGANKVKPEISVHKPEEQAPKTEAKTPKSDVTPSLVASSDIMGPNHQADIQLSQERLNDVQSRDPQENVRNFLSFQRLSQLQPVTDPATPPAEHTPMSDSPKSTKETATLSENLRQLPKLHIPSIHAPSELTFSPNSLAQRTITPSVLQKSRQLPHSSRERSANPYSSLLSPSDFYRHDPHYGERTPLSSGDTPLTAIPLGPSRYNSQSVPPDMRFGGRHALDESGAQVRPSFPKLDNHRRLHSAINGQSFQSLVPVAERSPLPPIDTPQDLENTPRAAHCRHNPFSPNSAHANDVIHSGWMKKRKTTKLIRHEWEEHHFALRGTHLCMYPDEEASSQNSKALERIDVDDYAVACSSLPSNSKLTAAFKKTVLKRSNDPRRDAAFVFSLIPSSNTNSSSFERKSFFAGSKSHHFAVTTREERIDWMRELMLAKALRRGQESGDSLNLNGQPF
ncbi:uncharacterized protein BJX67DRAFT_362596 [Aspergillus lucknowensis]|uniref:SAM and PH domain protein n=1 Tax=Aspergillus lucknowensis TaxID=176173 RepID=A0ABR4LGY9_9EURO